LKQTPPATIRIAPAMQYEGEPVIVPYLEHIPGDIGAQKSWLYNRQPERWRDRKQVEHKGSLEHRISLMTPEERLQRLRELQEKARLAIEGKATEVEEDRAPVLRSSRAGSGAA
jgi:hypothetical protein